MIRLLIALFIIILVICGIGKCFTEEKTLSNKIFTSLLTVFGIITGGAVFFQMLPSPASPQINELYFYAHGQPSDFSFYCEFYARNDGATLCELEKIECVLNKTEFKIAQSATLTEGFSGGGGGRIGAPSKLKKHYSSSSFPQSLPSTNQIFRIMGKGKNESIENASFDSSNIEIKFYFLSKGKRIVINRIVPISTNRPIENIRFN